MTPHPHCHKLVAETAKAMAAEAIDTMLRDDKMYAAAKATYPDLGRKALEATLLEKTWPYLVEQARATLAKMLRGTLSDELKSTIADALILDNGLAGRSRSSGPRLGPATTK